MRGPARKTGRLPSSIRGIVRFRFRTIPRFDDPGASGEDRARQVPGQDYFAKRIVGVRRSESPARRSAFVQYPETRAENGPKSAPDPCGRYASGRDNPVRGSWPRRSRRDNLLSRCYVNLADKIPRIGRPRFQKVENRASFRLGPAGAARRARSGSAPNWGFSSGLEEKDCRACNLIAIRVINQQLFALFSPFCLRWLSVPGYVPG